MTKRTIYSVLVLIVIFFVFLGIYIWGIVLVPKESPIILPPPTATSTVTIPDGWVATSSGGVTFSYPSKLPTTYISTQDWPPQAQVTDGPFTCSEGGNEIMRAGKTQKETINGHIYCVTLESQGAAGSIYNQYAYAFPQGDKVVILTFTLRLPQCPNYPEPKMSECQNERNSFSIDTIIDQIAQTVKM